MTSRTTIGEARGVAARPLDHLLELLGRLAQVGLHDHAGRGPVAQLRVGEQLEHEPHRRLERVDRLHVDVQVGAELARADEQRPHAPGRVVAADVGRLGPQQRAQRRHLHGQVHARQRPERVAARAPAGPATPAPPRRASRARPCSAPRSGPPRPEVTVASPSRSSETAAPCSHRCRIGLTRLARRLADDEAVRHVAHPGRGGRPERGSSRAGAGHPHRRLDRGRALVDLLQVLGQMPREVVERAAGRRHVDEAEQRGSQLGVLGGELHRLLVEGTQRIARSRGEGGVDRAPHTLKIPLH